MSVTSTELFQRLQAFSLDRTDAALPFSHRLARENGWTIDEAQRAIEEYQRFAFLAVVADLPVTPSDAVDQLIERLSNAVYLISRWIA